MKSLLSRLLAALSPSSATTTVSVSLALLICTGCETPRRATTPRPRTDREKELYERICRQPTLADCKEYNTEGFRAHRGEVFKVAESLRYHQAVDRRDGGGLRSLPAGIPVVCRGQRSCSRGGN